MSTMETGQRDWPNISDQKLDSKYEKCRNITEEIYKRIDITFQIKKLEAGQSELSDNSEQIDSNELSNETDLFACDKSDITSSTEAEKPPTDCGKFININNNEEKNKPAPAVYKRPKKRFRKRVKKRPVRARSDSEGSSDEAPLSRIADTPNVLILAAEIGAATAVLKPKTEKRSAKKETKKSPASKKPVPTGFTDKTLDKKNDMTKILSVRVDKLPIQDVMLSVKNYRSFMKDNKLTIKSDAPLRNDPATDMSARNDEAPLKDIKVSTKTDKLSLKTDKLSVREETDNNSQWKSCSLCSLSFRGERGLRGPAVPVSRTSSVVADGSHEEGPLIGQRNVSRRIVKRHISMSHIMMPEDCK